MFRATKPLVKRARVEKGTSLCVPDPVPDIPSAIVPPLPCEPKTPPPKGSEQEAETTDIPLDVPLQKVTPSVVEKPKLPDLQIPGEVTMLDVQLWEERHKYRPWTPENSDDGEKDEDMRREVREERIVEPGNDPLIDEMLDLFPEEADPE